MEWWQKKKGRKLGFKAERKLSIFQRERDALFRKQTETGLKVSWDDLEIGLGARTDILQVFKGRQDEPWNLCCISKAVSMSLKYSSDVLASDECDIDKLLKHGLLSLSAASRVGLQWEVFQTRLFFFYHTVMMQSRLLVFFLVCLCPRRSAHDSYLY